MTEALRWRDIAWRERRWVIYGLVRRLQPNARVLTIHAVIEQEYQKDLSIAWLYSCLDRLEQEGYLRCESKPVPTKAEHIARGQRNALYYFATGKPRPHARTASRRGGLLQPQTA